MPELPEVELVSRYLDAIVRGRVILGAALLRERLAPDSTVSEFSRMLSGTKIDRVGRRGKHILIHLNNGRTLIVHLRMSGRFSLLDLESEDPKFTHAVFCFADGERLVFDDQRHFGLMKIVETARLHEAKEIAKLAPEPLSEDFSIAYFRRALAASGRSLKEVLLDQTKVCGLGNIYAAEAMFAAGVDPRIPARALSTYRAARLHRSIRAVLREAIRHSADRTVVPDDMEDSYFKGGNPDGWYVYGRENKPCLNCKASIIRLKQGGRSTFYCPRCQRK
jgi:formamidopyrimidine-DNA glycosylase